MPVSNNEPVIRHVLVLVAMHAEAAPMIARLGLRERLDVLNVRLPMRCFQHRDEQLTLSLVTAGVDERYQVDHVGSEPAALMAYESIERLKPDLLISAGTAGGFAEKGAHIGTVYLSDHHFIFHDRHVPLPGLQASALGQYPALHTRRMATSLGLPYGVISTGSSLEKSRSDLAIMRQHGAVAKEMEAAGIAWVASLLHVPMMAVKSITNLVDRENRSEEEFAKHFDEASQALTETLIRVIEYISGQRLSDL